MHYPVMTERQLAFRWKISLKTLRRWRAEDEGPTWHKFFQYVRYHEADVLDFERQSAQHWTAILGDGERVPKVVTRPPQEQIETEEDDGAFYITAQGVIEATGLPKHWFTTPEYRARKQVRKRAAILMLPLFCGVLSSLLTRLFCAVPRTSVSRIAWG